MISRIAEIHGLEGNSVRKVNGKDRAVSVTPALVGAAANGHEHAEADINSLTTTMNTIRNATKTAHASARAQSVLQEGVNIVNAKADGLADVEIEGRTLISMANSNLEAGKKYVIADKKTKVVADGQTISGVGKFSKGTTSVTTGDFAGKVAGSNSANPHFFGHLHAGNMNNPSVFIEHSGGYPGISALGGSSAASGHSSLTAGGMGTHIFGFNVIEQVERTIGLIPRNTITEKVQWLKDNIESFTFNWHGHGISPSGNKASVLRWVNGGWATAVTHQSPTTALISYAVTRAGGSERPSDFLASTNDGFVYFLAHSDPTDGVTSSIIYSDYAALTINPKPTAQLNTRPRIIRIENFEGKEAKDTTKNPHIMRYGNGELSTNPTTLGEDLLGYDSIKKQDGVSKTQVSVGMGHAQHIFSFDILESIERNIGKIPKASLSDKVEWLKLNVVRLTCLWRGYGSSYLGPQASFRQWRTQTVSWMQNLVHQNSGHTNLIIRDSHPLDKITEDGFVHFLAYSEVSNGTVASTLNTDYVELEIELKSTADFRAPRVPLYEVDDAIYNNILGVWPEDEVVKRYPAVEGMQHLTNPYLVSEGDNLLPPFTEWVSHDRFKIESPYKVVMNSNAVGQQISWKAKVIPGATYTLSVGELGDRIVYIVGAKLNGTKVNFQAIVQSAISSTFAIPNDVFEIEIFPSSIAAGLNRDIVFSNLMLTHGTELKAFKPKNTSYLHSKTNLSSFGNEKDVFFKEDGKWKVRKKTKTDVVIDGNSTLTPSYQFEHTPNHKRFYLWDVTQPKLKNRNSYELIDPSGKKIPIISTYRNDNEGTEVTEIGLFIQMSNAVSGFSSSHVPSTLDIKRYLNGWKYTNGTTWTSVTGNGQVATDQQALDTKPTDYTPFKLSYVLATPVIEEVSVEGDLKVNGLTQVEMGSGIFTREKVTPPLSGVHRYINTDAIPGSFTKNKVLSFVNVYKNGQLDTSNWEKLPSTSNGLQRLRILENQFDPKAEYTVTYIALDKHKLTTNISDTKIFYPQDFSTSFRDMISRAEDLKTQASVNHKAILDAYVQLAAMKGGV